MNERLFTIGYTEPGAQERIDAFLAQDRARNILMDIRLSPRSRWLPQFNRSALYRCYGGQYIHCSVLGNLNYRPEDRGKGIAIANAEQGVARVVDLLENDCSVMLMCACKDYEACHRKVVYDLVVAAMAEAERRERRRLFFSAMRRPEMRVLRAALSDLRNEHGIDWRLIKSMQIETPCLPGTPWMLVTDQILLVCYWPDRDMDFTMLWLHQPDDPGCKCDCCYEERVCHVRMKEYYIALQEEERTA